MVRRIFSVILYLIGALFFQSEGLMAFAAPDRGWDKILMMAFFVPFILVPLSVGALVSPGNRLREVGLTLLVTCGLLAAWLSMVIYMTIMPDTRMLFPPGARGLFTDYLFGAVNLALFAGLGWLLFRRGRQPRVDDIFT